MDDLLGWFSLFMICLHEFRWLCCFDSLGLVAYVVVVLPLVFDFICTFWVEVVLAGLLDLLFCCFAPLGVLLGVLLWT